jgi:hypothetical protein
VHKTFLYGTITPNTSTAAGYASLGGAPFWSIIVNPFLGIGGAANWNDATVSTVVGDAGASQTITRFVDPDRATLAPLINEIRPVSAYLYVSFVGDTLNDGGQTAAAFMPSGGVNNGAPTWSSQMNANLQNVNELSLQPGAYLGPASKGCYIRWSPEDERDSFFYQIPQANAYEYPTLVASGVVTQARPNIRWIVEVNYELTTQSRILTQIPSPIDTRLIEHAKRALQAMPYACANDDHESLWTRFLGWARGAVQSVKNFFTNDVGPLLAPVGNVLTAVGLPEVGAPMAAAGHYLSG